MEELKEVISISIKDSVYTFDIKNLSAGDFLDIESYKQALSRGQYSNMSSTLSVDPQQAANLIDMISCFRVLEPKIEQGLATKSFEKLNLIDCKELLTVYVKEFLPWYRGWMGFLNSTPEDSDEQK